MGTIKRINPSESWNWASPEWSGWWHALSPDGLHVFREAPSSFGKNDVSEATNTYFKGKKVIRCCPSRVQLEPWFDPKGAYLRIRTESLKEGEHWIKAGSAGDRLVLAESAVEHGHILDEITLAAIDAHHQYWRSTRDAGKGGRLANKVTRSWQERFVREDDIKTEFQLNGLNEKIDVVQIKNKTAYEMKVSGNNPYHEFYKDIFKILVFNEANAKISIAFQIEHFVFLTEDTGALRLRSNLGKEAMSLALKLGLKSIQVVGIPKPHTVAATQII